MGSSEQRKKMSWGKKKEHVSALGNAEQQVVDFNDRGNWLADMLMETYKEKFGNMGTQGSFAKPPWETLITTCKARTVTGDIQQCILFRHFSDPNPNHPIMLMKARHVEELFYANVPQLFDF